MDKDAFNNLMKRIRNNDMDAFREFYERYGKKIKTVAFYTVQDYHAAEDILSDVMIKIWNGTFGEVDVPNGFIYKMARNTALDFLRRDEKNRNALRYSEELEQEAVATIDMLHMDIAVDDALKKLGEMDKEVILKYVLFNYKFREIASDMKISISAAQRRYRRVIKLLKKSCAQADSKKGEYQNE